MLIGRGGGGRYVCWYLVANGQFLCFMSLLLVIFSFYESGRTGERTGASVGGIFLSSSNALLLP